METSLVMAKAPTAAMLKAQLAQQLEAFEREKALLLARATAAEGKLLIFRHPLTRLSTSRDRSRRVFCYLSRSFLFIC